MARKFDNILETIGHTPVVKINKLAPPHVTLWAKIEAFQSFGLGEGPPGAGRHRGG